MLQVIRIVSFKINVGLFQWLIASAKAFVLNIPYLTIISIIKYYIAFESNHNFVLQRICGHINLYFALNQNEVYRKRKNVKYQVATLIKGFISLLDKFHYYIIQII